MAYQSEFNGESMTVDVSEPISAQLWTDIDPVSFDRSQPGRDTRSREHREGVITRFSVDTMPPSGTNPLPDQTRYEPMSVLVISHDRTLKNLLETICMTHRVQMVTAAEMPAPWGPARRSFYVNPTECRVTTITTTR